MSNYTSTDGSIRTEVYMNPALRAYTVSIETPDRTIVLTRYSHGEADHLAFRVANAPDTEPQWLADFLEEN